MKTVYTILFLVLCTITLKANTSEVKSTNEKVDFFEWYQNPHIIDDKVIKVNNNLIWQNSPILQQYDDPRKLYLKSAKQYCKKLTIRTKTNTYRNFRLPTKNEADQLVNYVDLLNKHSKYGSYKGGSGMVDFFATKGDEKNGLKMREYQPDYSYTKNNYSWYSGSRMSILKTVAICVQKTKHSGYNIQNLVKEYLKKDKKNIVNRKFKSVKPTKPRYTKVKRLLKGEFEKTIKFTNRIKEYEQTVKEKNKLKDTNYQEELLRWKKEKKEFEEEKQKELSESNLNKHYTKALKKAFHIKYGRPILKDIKYDADKEIFTIRISSFRNNFKGEVTIPIKLNKAKKFKSILSEQFFIPTVQIKVSNNNIQLIGIKELKDSVLFWIKDEYRKISNNRRELKKFISKYKDSKYVNLMQEAESKFNTLEKEYQRWLKEEDRKQKKRWKRENEQKERQKKIREAHYTKKYVGDKVCKDGNMAILLSITITAYVEKVNGNSIQLRISDTEGTSPHMNGVTLHRNTLIWDNYSDWYKCNH